MATTGNIAPPIGNVGETPSFSQGVAPSSTNGGASDKDMFLKLLVAQMKYQDPSKPADSSEMLSQMAQFTMVEKMDALTSAFTNELQATELTSATGMLGNTITFTKDKTTTTGVVTGVSIVNGSPTLLVGATEVSLSDVTKIVKGTTTPSTPAT
jgi:flagellar basal-body rod modification protein FlgD